MADQMQSEDFGSVHGFIVDIMTESLISINKSGLFRIWAVAHCQILMDILDALGMKPRTGYDILQDTLARESVSSRIEKYSKMASLPHSPAQQIKMEEKIADALKSKSDSLRSSEEPPGKHGRLSGRPPGLTGTFTWPADRHPEDLLPALPILSGVRFNNLAFSRCLVSIQKANQSVSLLGMAYVYRASQAFGLLHGSWPDMDSVITSQSMHGSYLFEANDLEGYARHFDLAIGVSPAAFSSDKGRSIPKSRPTVPSAAKIAAKMKKLKPTSSYLLSVQETVGMKGRVNRGQFYEILYLTAQRVYNTEREASLTPQELLNALQKSLLEDEVYLKFDYGGFSLRCQAFLNAARYTPSEKLGHMKKVHKYFSSGVGKVEDFIKHIGDVALAELVHAALWEAAELEKEGPGWKVKAECKLATIAGVIQGAIYNDPESWLSIARQGSSGYIADLDAPYRHWKWGGKAPVFGPITPQQHLRREESAKTSNIQNAACAHYRELESLGLSTTRRIAKVKAFMDQRLIEAGVLDVEMGEVKIIPEYRFISIGLKPKMHRRQEL